MAPPNCQSVQPQRHHHHQQQQGPLHSQASQDSHSNSSKRQGPDIAMHQAGGQGDRKAGRILLLLLLVVLLLLLQVVVEIGHGIMSKHEVETGMGMVLATVRMMSHPPTMSHHHHLHSSSQQQRAAVKMGTIHTVAHSQAVMGGQKAVGMMLVVGRAVHGPTHKLGRESSNSSRWLVGSSKAGRRAGG
jgi:hypothetical protein